MRVLVAASLAVFAFTKVHSANESIVREFAGLTSYQDATRFARCGLLKIHVGADGFVFSGQMRLGPDAFVFIGVFDQQGNAHFGASGTTVRELVRPGRGNVDLAFTRGAGPNGTPQVTGTLFEKEGGALHKITAAPAVYVAAENPPAPLRQTPGELRGSYTVILPPTAPDAQALPRSEYPQGFGVGTLRVRGTGQVTLAGRLADGSVLSCGGPLCVDQTWSLWNRLYHGDGGIVALARFRDTPGVSDFDAFGSKWFKPVKATSARYPDGWIGGIKVDVLGSKYAVPDASERRSVFTGLSAPVVEGNARFMLQRGGLRDADTGDTDPQTPLTKFANINDRDRIQMLNPGPEKFSSVLNPVNGLITGTFRHNRTHTSANYRAVIFQKQARAFGYFISPHTRAP